MKRTENDTVSVVDHAQRTLFYAGIAGGIGGIVGAVGGVISRGRMGVLASTLASFSGYSIFGIGYFGCREALMATNPGLPRMNSAVAGSLFGGIVGLPLGPVRSLQSAALYGVLGLAGQLGIEEFDAMQARRAAERLLEQELDDLAESDQGDASAAEALRAHMLLHQAPSKGVLRGEEAETERERLRELTERRKSIAGDGIVARVLSGKPGDLGTWDSMQGLPDWIPIKVETAEQAEQRLLTRLEEIELTLMRDDRAKAMIAERARGGAATVKAASRDTDESRK